MLTVTNEAAEVLKAVKTAQGAPPEAGVRIVKRPIPDGSGKLVSGVGFAISEDPAPDDEELEQNGLRIFVEESLIEPLNGRTLDVQENDVGLEIIFR